jgi:hypothetical protein
VTAAESDDENPNIPEERNEPLIPRAAFSHSNSLGSFPLRHDEYATASYQSTPVTGEFAEAAMPP